MYNRKCAKKGNVNLCLKANVYNNAVINIDLDEVAVKKLAAAVIMQAVNDYIGVQGMYTDYYLRNNCAKINKNEIELFLKSKWGALLCDVLDKDSIILLQRLKSLTVDDYKALKKEYRKC